MQEFASSICAVASSRRFGDECFYTQELFEKEEFTGHLNNTMESEKSVYDRIVYDSAGMEKGVLPGFPWVTPVRNWPGRGLDRHRRSRWLS